MPRPDPAPVALPVFSVRCPECGVEPSRRPPCPVCRGRCCDCYHDDDDPNDPELTPAQAAALRRMLTRRGIMAPE